MPTDATEAKIRAFADLAAGWCYGEGVPITDATIERAISILHSRDMHETDAFPCLDGGVLVAFYPAGSYHGIRVNPDGTTEVDDDG